MEEILLLKGQNCNYRTNGHYQSLQNNVQVRKYKGIQTHVHQTRQPTNHKCDVQTVMLITISVNISVKPKTVLQEKNLLFFKQIVNLSHIKQQL